MATLINPPHSHTSPQIFLLCKHGHLRSKLRRYKSEGYPMHFQNSRHAERCLASSNLVVQALEKTSNVLTSADKDSLVRFVNITNDTLGIRVCSYGRLKYEVEYGLKRGTTDNSYIIRGKEKMALIDIPDQNFAKEYTRALMDLKNIQLLRCLIIGHLSPKRIDTVISIGEALAQTSFPLEIYCSNPAAQLLSVSIPEKLKDVFHMKVVRSGDSLDLGGGHKLQFILTPTPRWPDGICTYDPATQLIFTNKFFSAHVYLENDFDIGGWESYGVDWQFFYDCMLSPVVRQVQRNSLLVLCLFVLHVGMQGWIL